MPHPLLPLSIFVAEMAVVAISTMRIIFIGRGLKAMAAGLGFFEVTIWLFAIGQVMTNLDSPVCFAAFAGGFVAGKWSIADAAFAPFIMRLESVLSLNPPTVQTPGLASQVLEVLRSERFALLQQWKRDIVARPSMAKTYDEVCSTSCPSTYHLKR